jgi:hypothetical protein
LILKLEAIMKSSMRVGSLSPAGKNTIVSTSQAFLVLESQESIALKSPARHSARIDPSAAEPIAIVRGKLKAFTAQGFHIEAISFKVYLADALALLCQPGLIHSVGVHIFIIDRHKLIGDFAVLHPGPVEKTEEAVVAVVGIELKGIGDLETERIGSKKLAGMTLPR